MSSEVIVVLVLIVIAVGFILWVRRHSHADEANEQAIGTVTRINTGNDQK